MNYRPKLNVNLKMIQLHKEDMEENLCDLGVGQDFSDMTQKAKTIKFKK